MVLGLIGFVMALAFMGAPLVLLPLTSRLSTRSSRIGGALAVAVMVVVGIGVAVSISGAAIAGVSAGALVLIVMGLRGVSRAASAGRVGRPLSPKEVDGMLANVQPQEVDAVIAAERARRAADQP